SNIFDMLESEGMKYFKLIYNFRSHFEIVNYANLLHDSSEFLSYEKDVSHVILCRTNDYLSSINAFFETGELDMSKSVTIIANINEDAKQIADGLNRQGYPFLYIPRTPIDGSSNYSNVLRTICCYILDDKYSVYDVAEILRVEQQKGILNKL